MKSPLPSRLFLAVAIWTASSFSSLPSLAAPPPPPADLNWEQAPLTSSATRTTLALDGIWKFTPAAGTAAQPPSADDWGWIHVPASWSGRNANLTRAETAAWKDFTPRTAPAAWYEREFIVPDSARGRDIALDFQRVSTNAVVFVDSQRAGEVNWPEGEVNITSLVTPGRKSVLRVYVAAAHDKEFIDVLMGTLPGQNTQQKATLSTQGLTGSVVLLTRPAGPRLDGVFIQPSVRQKQLILDVELANLKPASAPIKFTAAIHDAKTGQLAKSAQLSATPDPATGVARLVIPWENPKLWGLDEPNLYRLTLTASAAGLNDQLTERFGFRELWIEGKNLLLNGTVFRISPILVGSPQQGTADVMASAVGREIQKHRGDGFNFAELWPEDIETRGTNGAYLSWHAPADEAGFPMSGILPHMGWMGSNINSPQKMETYALSTTRIFKRLRNHPSIVIWATSGNAIGGNLDPRYLGQREASAKAKHARLPGTVATDALIKSGVDAIKRIDTTRPVLVHNGGNVGDIFNNNYYFNFVPLQERMEYLRFFEEHGDMPLWFVEFGTPLYSSFMRGRNSYGPTTATEPFVLEYAAIYFGSSVYAMDSSAYLAEMRSQFVKDQSYRNWHHNRILTNTPAFQAVQSLFLSETWRTWRTTTNASMIPWDHFYRNDQEGNLSNAGRALIANNQATLAWISGAAPTVVDKTHQFSAGETVKKSAALINDGFQPQPYELTWTAVIAGQTKSGTDRGTLAPAERKLVPIEFALPAQASAEVLSGTISLDAKIGEVRHSDKFAFSLVPKPAAKLELPAALLYDPKGLTGKLLTAFDVKLPAWDGSSALDPATTPLLIIGREALSVSAHLPASVEAYVKAGGRVLMMEQQADYLRKALGFRVSPHVSRQFFPLNSSAPVLGPLTAQNLRYWRGTSTLLPEFLDEPRSPETRLPKWGWHLSNRHGVSSGAIEKPHRSGWRPLVEGEFDLAYSPLLELDYGTGRVFLNQFSFEDQAGADPAAALLFTQLLNYAATSPALPRVGAVQVLSAGAVPASFSSLGIQHNTTAELSDDTRLVVIAPGAKIPANFQRWVEAGGRALVLAQSQAEGLFASQLTLPRDNEAKPFTGALEVPAWPEMRGISVSDLRFRNHASVWRITGGPGLEIAANGLFARRQLGRGVILFSQLDPSLPEADTRTYLRLTRWRQMRAQSQLLANLGATFAADNAIFNPLPPEAEKAPTVSLAVPWRLEFVKKLAGAPSPDKGYPDPGMSEAAKALLAPDYNDSAWTEAIMPQPHQNARLDWSGMNGEVVLRVTFDVPETLQGKDLEVSLGAVDDGDITYFNGVEIGRLIEDPQGHAKQRVYPIPAKLVRPTGNVLAIRVWDRFGGGGLTATKPELLVVRAPEAAAPVVSEQATRPDLYHPDYLSDFPLGDDPYRYYNW